MLLSFIQIKVNEKSSNYILSCKVKRLRLCIIYIIKLIKYNKYDKLVTNKKLIMNLLTDEENIDKERRFMMVENFNVGNLTKENVDYAFKNLVFYVNASLQLNIYKAQKENFEKSVS